MRNLEIRKNFFISVSWQSFLFFILLNLIFLPQAVTMTWMQTSSNDFVIGERNDVQVTGSGTGAYLGIVSPNWTNMNPATKPSARQRHAMAYDSANQKIVLFGGSVGGDETWVYDLAGNTWTNMNPATKPSARQYHAMAYDSANQRIVLFGGNDGTSDDETWVYDLANNS